MPSSRSIFLVFFVVAVLVALFAITAHGMQDYHNLRSRNNIPAKADDKSNEQVNILAADISENSNEDIFVGDDEVLATGDDAEALGFEGTFSGDNNFDVDPEADTLAEIARGLHQILAMEADRIQAKIDEQSGSIDNSDSAPMPLDADGEDGSMTSIDDFSDQALFEQLSAVAQALSVFDSSRFE